MSFLAIVLLCILSAVTYGIAHDQITVRVCVEYFTIGHPPIFDTESPTLLAFGWGIVATWWVGLILGIGMAIAARAGSRPGVAPGALVRPIAWLFVITGICAAAAGVLGHFLARMDLLALFGPTEVAVPREKHVSFLAALWAHNASYLVGFVGGLVVVWQTWRRRTGISEPRP